MYRRIIPYSITKDVLLRNASYYNLFVAFAKQACARHSTPYRPVPCLADNELVELWLTSIFLENRGKTRPASGRRAINAKRKALGIPELPRFGNIAKICAAAQRQAATSIKKSASLPIAFIKDIVDAYRLSPVCYRLQVAPMTAIGFLCIMRLGELKKLFRTAFCFVLGNLVEVPAVKRRRLTQAGLPPLNSIRALKIHCPWRKTSRNHGTWLLTSDRKIIHMMHIHLANLAQLQYQEP